MAKMLTGRERLVSELLEEGKTQKEISSQLGISVGRIYHLISDARRKQLFPIQSYERMFSSRTILFLRNTCGPEEITPARIQRWLFDGTLVLYGHRALFFKGIKARDAGRATFLELCDYAGVSAGQLRGLKNAHLRAREVRVPPGADIHVSASR